MRLLRVAAAIPLVLALTPVAGAESEEDHGPCGAPAEHPGGD